ncbi:MAG: nuclear transport factor 2 family protein [Pseudonocardia sp.]|nr:nuclear transport factor 2 family protein [Pseudonocardia sp.]
MEDNHIADARARNFVAALRKFEQDSDAAPLVALFATDAVTERLDARGERHGEVEQFWQEYRAQFREIRTTFFNAVEGQDQVALEWRSQAILTDDRPLTYRGVTVIDLDGDAIVRLRTYYDSAAFVLVPAATT